MSAALEYHRATSVPAGGTDEDEQRFVGARPSPFKDYGDAERLPLDSSVVGPLLQAGAGVVRSQPRRDYGGGTLHWRAYSSAGALYPVEAYGATADGLYSFDPLGRSLVRIAEGDARAAVGAAADARAEAFVVVTGIHARTGWKYLERGYRHVWWDAGTMLANVLALAAADGLSPRLYVGFVDGEVNAVLGVDGVTEYTVAVVGLGHNGSVRSEQLASRASSSSSPLPPPRRYPLAEAAHEASSLADLDAVRAWRAEPDGEEPRLARDELLEAIRRRRSIRRYARDPVRRGDLVHVLAWSEAPVPADVPRVVRQTLTVAAAEGLGPGTYDARLELLRDHDERDLRQRVGFAAMEQDHVRLAAVNVFQMADLDAVIATLGERGYRWAQLEAGIRAGRLQVGAFMRGLGAAASTFFDEEVSRLLGTHEAPMLMVALGRRR